MSDVAVPATEEDALLVAARVEPHRTLAHCRRAVAEMRDAATVVRLRHAMAVAYAELREPPAAMAQLRRALSVARDASGVGDTGSLHLTMAWLMLEGSDPAGCLSELDRARPLLDTVRRARARCLGGTALHVAGDHAAAERELSGAIRALDAGGERHWLANALNARASARGYLGMFGTGDADLARAQVIFEELGEPARAACCRHNRGFLALRDGNLPRAMELFEAAEKVGADGETLPELLIDRSQMLLAVGLVRDARAAAERAVGMLAVTGRAAKLAEAALTVADCALLAGEPEVAASTAERAERLLRGQHRPAWTVAARARTVLARLVLDGSGDGWTASAARLAGDCDASGWPGLAARLRLTAARTAEPEPAGELLRPVMAGRFSRHAELAVPGWIARARLAGTPAAAAAAARAGLRRLDAAGSPFVRDRAELVDIGLGAALVRGAPDAALTWMDRHRPVEEGAPPVRAPRQPGPRCGGVDRQELATTLADAVLVRIACSAGRLLAVSVVDGRFRLHELCGLGEAIAACQALRLAAWPGGRPEALGISASELDRLLIRPVLRAVGCRPLVLVPPPELLAVPWAALPSCRARPLSVAPSVSDWVGASRWARGEGRGEAWVAGPGLRHGERETRALCPPSGMLLAGVDATPARVLAAMDGARVAHLAVHARFRVEAPSLSSLRLAGGPLYGYDLAGLARPPELLVLAACESGRLTAEASGRVDGLATTLLRRGTRAVIGSVLPVPDAAATPLMAGLHAGLRDGHGPAAALAGAQAEHGDLGFVCLGAG